MAILNTAFADSIVEEVSVEFNNMFNLQLQKTPQFSVFDLEDKINKIAIEIKQRNINHDRYSTAIIGWNKYLKARNYITIGYIPIFVWYYNDGIYCFKYNNEQFEKKNNGYGADIINISIDKLVRLELFVY